MKYFLTMSFPRRRESRSMESGVSTIEMLIAFLVVILSITAVIGVVFGSQSIGLDTETNQEAQLIGVDLLEDARAAARFDFNTVPGTVPTPGNFYQTWTNIFDIPPCVKDIVSLVQWVDEIRPQSVELKTRVTSPKEALAVDGDCPSGPPPTPWKNPQSDDLGDLIEPSGNDGVDVDAIEDEVTGDKLALLGSQHSQTDKSDLWIFDVNDPATPTLLNIGGMDLSGNCTNDTPRFCGVSAIDAAGHHAYIANLGNGDLSGPPDSDFRNAQLQIIDISDPANPVRESFFSLNDASIPVPKRVSPLGSFPEGRVLYFYEDKIYIGLKETAGHEFHIIDVSDPSVPTWLGSYKLGTGIGHNVNAIIVREQNYLGSPKKIAFVTSSVTEASHPEVYILDVTDPNAISQIGSFNPAGIRYGLGLAVAGNRLYLGRYGESASSDNSFHIADITNLASPTELGPGHNFRASVSSLAILGELAFLGTDVSNSEFQIWNISNPDTIFLHNCDNFDFAQLGNGIDYHDNIVYVAVRSQNAFRIIYDTLDPVCS